MYCGWRELKLASKRESARLSFVSLRYRELAVTAKTLATEQHHSSTLRRFIAHITDMDVDLIDVNPMHVMSYLMSLDANAREVLHTLECTSKATKKRSLATCGCPPRAKAGSIDTNNGWLSACFNELGKTGEYDPRTGAGNPCHSQTVRSFVAAIGKEQTRLGVFPHQAPAFNLDIFDSMLLHCLAQAQLARSQLDIAAEFAHLQNALLFSLLYNTYNRGVNIVELQWDQLQLLPGVNGGVDTLLVSCGMTKTTGTRGTRHLIAIAADGVATLGAYSTVALYTRYLDMTEHHLLDYGARTGCIFRKDIRRGTVHMPTVTLQAALTATASALGLARWHITIHSFRASGAIAAIFAGMPTEVVMYRAGWAGKDMLHYYTYMRQILTLEELGAVEQLQADTADDGVDNSASRIGGSSTPKLPAIKKATSGKHAAGPVRLQRP